jgi:bifunctional ADP-heptose synthase (sugar kinase/adenylyltransferase)
MDTRNKIISPERAAEVARELRANGRQIKVVTGYFDVLLAAHVRRLAEITRGKPTLLAIVVDPAEALLPARARAELVAALGMVDYVVPAGEQAAQALLNQFHAGEVVREESADLLRSRRLKEHVQSRHQR